jgi:PleD family two-component response regulator
VVSRQASRSETIAKALHKRGLAMVAFETTTAAAASLGDTAAEAVLIEATANDAQLVPLVQQIRASAAHPGVPILLVAADKDAPMVVAALEAGATEVLPRSSSTQTVVETLRTRLVASLPATG